MRDFLSYRKFLCGTAFIAAACSFQTTPAQAFAISFTDMLSVYADLGVKSDIIGVSDKESDAVGDGARNFVNKMGSRALDFLGNSQLSQTQKKSKFQDLLEDSFDMNTIGRFALGRYWRTSSKQQREEYLTLFKDMVVDVYANRFNDYSGQGFEARTYRRDSEKDTIVTSFVVPESGPEIQVDWRVRYKKGRYKVVDIIVEGVSMSVTQRSDFSSVIQRGGGNIEALLTHLRNPGSKSKKS